MRNEELRRRREQEERASQPAQQERSRSIPDTVPCRGPTSGRGASPISDLKLRSNFGRNQQISASRENTIEAGAQIPYQTRPTEVENSQSHQSLRMPRGRHNDDIDVEIEQVAQRHRIVPTYHMQLQEQNPIVSSELKLKDQRMPDERSSRRSLRSLRSKSSGVFNNVIKDEKKREFAQKLKSTQAEVQDCLGKQNQSLAQSVMCYEQKQRGKSAGTHNQRSQMNIIQLDKEQYQERRGLALTQMQETQSQSTVGLTQRTQKQENLNTSNMMAAPQQNFAQSQGNLNQASKHSLNAHQVINSNVFTHESQ